MAESHHVAADDIEPAIVDPAGPPPRRLTSVPGKPHYHPSCLRVGVRVNGAERSDLIEYDQDAGTAKTRNDAVISGTIEPFWRYEESRQERRGRERWEQKHGRSR